MARYGIDFDRAWELAWWLVLRVPERRD